MSLDRPSRYARRSTDTMAPVNEGPSKAARPDPETLLEDLAETLRGLGERATVRRVIDGQPFIHASGGQGLTQLNEKIGAKRRPDGKTVAFLSWGTSCPPTWARPPPSSSA